jgi:DNA helicase IV
MEAIIAVAIMVVVLELREHRLASRLSKVEDSLECLQAAIGSLVNTQEAVSAKAEGFNISLSDKISKLEDSTEMLKVSHESMVREYELRMRRIDDEQVNRGIDGIEGL